MTTLLRTRLAKPVTARDFEKFDPEWRYDLIRGELQPMPPPPGAEHGAITLDLSFEVTAFVKRHALGRCFAAETRFVIEEDPDTALAPDWAFVARHRLPAELPTGFLHLVPDIVLEVRSPGDRRAEVAAKVQRWLAAGARLVWELNPRTRVLTVHRPDDAPRELGPADTLTGEPVLPGFALPLQTILG